MIPQCYIQAWRDHAPWPNPAQVEQDLIICRALCDLFNAPALAGKIAFRGGTAIHKLLFKQPLRYSEDIDLVQTQAEPIGATVDAIRDALSWLGKCQREQAGHTMHLVFRFAPESAPQTALKLKVEINTREHEVLFGYRRHPFEVASDWYSARTEIVSRSSPAASRKTSSRCCRWVCASTKPWRSMRSTTCGQPSLRGFAETRGGSPPMWSRSFEPSTQGS